MPAYSGTNSIRPLARAGATNSRGPEIEPRRTCRLRFERLAVDLGEQLSAKSNDPDGDGPSFGAADCTDALLP